MTFSKVDLNHAEIKNALIKKGCKIISLASLRHGKPDLLVCYRNSLFLFEIKSEKGKLTKDEQQFFDDWASEHGVNLFIVRSVEQALEIIESF